MSDTILLLVYILAALAFPFGIAFALRYFINKVKDNQDAEPSGPSKSYEFSSNYNRGYSNYSKQTNKHSYKPWEEERKIIFRKKADSYISVDSTLYKATLSVIALFSWVIRKDGSIGTLEMEVARSYFESHPIYNDILFFSPQEKGDDPISNNPYQYIKDCMDLLRYYNTCPVLLRYEKCCQYIKEADIYYTAAMDLIKALCQVAYSSDGVIDSEAEILTNIAQGLDIRHEGWINLMRMYGIGKKTKQKRKSESSRQYNSSTDDDAHEQEKKRSDEQQGDQKKSSSFGYKLTQAYNKLGLLTTASEEEIKDAYRTLVKKYHPDRLSPDATDQERRLSADQFRRVKEAYDLIRLERGK